MDRNGLTNLDAAVSEEVRAAIARDQSVTVKGLAERLGIRRATLSSRVHGHTAFTPSLLADVAAALGTTASDLVLCAEQTIAASQKRSAA